MINKKEYTLIVLRNVESLFNQVRKFVDKHSDILEFTIDEPMQLVIKDKSKTSNFQFSISNPKQENAKVIFEVNHNPFNTASIDNKKISTIGDSAMKELNTWTNLVRSYNEIKLTPDDNILNEYEKEFFQNFEILDDDAEVNPFELEKQIIIHNYFIKVIEVLETKEDQSNNYLIEEAKEIKDNISKMTKTATIRKISSFFARVRKKSLPILKELFEVGKKKFLKKQLSFY